MQGYRKVTAVWIELGAFSCIEPEALQVCFPAAAKHSLAEGAKLYLSRQPGRAWCDNCQHSVSVDSPGDACPQCGRYQLQLDWDNTISIKEIEVE